jgi:hypothetical protein
MSKISELYKKKLYDKNFLETLSAFDIWTYPKLKIIIKHNQEEIEILENYIKKLNKNDPSEILNKFFENNLIKTDDKNDYILKFSLYKDFNNYLENNKYEPISKISFYNFMSSKGFFEVRKEKNKKTLRIYEKIKKKI